MVDFYNPMNQIIEAAEILYPEIQCFVQFDPALGSFPFGVTIFGDDGSIVISISPRITITQSLEILAHELAHVIAGAEENHGERWEEVFANIQKKYQELAEHYCEAEEG